MQSAQKKEKKHLKKEKKHLAHKKDSQIFGTKRKGAAQKGSPEHAFNAQTWAPKIIAPSPGRRSCFSTPNS